MDDESGISVSPQDLQKLSPADHEHLQKFLQAEQQKASIQKSVHELTETCFKKCIMGSISSGKLASKEETCLQNCVGRYMDSNIAVLKHLETLRSQQ